MGGAYECDAQGGQEVGFACCDVLVDVGCGCGWAEWLIAFV